MMPGGSAPPTPSGSRAPHAPKGRRSDAARFYAHEVDEDEDAFYSSRKSSTDLDLETGCLIPPDADAAVPDLASPQTSRRRIYAAYRRWFSCRGGGGGASVRLAQEKGGEPPYRTSTLERRVMAGSWSAMVVLLVLTVYFLRREMR
ncbi:hypothetical protein B0H17DRAFT_1195034 [Mycena rosella]|uniref:Uncharacterized protein n=1 Tax=Mycena rosella TaxID=1033263 RepID=A0AAD7DX16_MYCRO|nr:hypothetical protein B0H17DRAFT_1195034 [Mycena rosella]